jgi:ABC-type nitrate/sulfonate/bicarbonate transport system substrate-binding protein
MKVSNSPSEEIAMSKQAAGKAAGGFTRRRVLKAAAAAAVAGVAPAVHTQNRKLDVVKGTLTPLLAYAHVYSAIDKGLFAKYGIENKIDSVALVASMPIVARGSYDWGRSSNGPGYFNALNSGLAIVSVVDRLTYTCSSDNCLSVATKLYDAGVRSFADLKGRSIGINAPGSATDYWVSRALQANKMTRADVRVVPMGYPELLAAMTTGSVEAGYLPEPLLTKGVMQGHVKVLQPVVDVVPGDNIGMMFFGKEFAAKTDLATRWLMAYIEGVRFAQDRANRDEVIRIVAKYTKVEVPVLESIYDKRITWPQVDANGRVDVQKMLAGQGQYFLESKGVDKLPEPSRVFDPTLLDAALKQVGEVPPGQYQLCKA